MNKEKVFPVLLLSLVLLLLLVSVPFACAAGDNESQEEPETKDSPDLPIADDGVENVKGITKNASTAALDATKEGLFGIGANTSDASPILLPESVSNPIRIIFGLSLIHI